ncbi:hypothetical protein A5674_13825 [Mycobacterium malmoense]|uniref:aminoglycoside phosphotransferase family protein n=1 Tax=Mycobacterium malmoense TaxID=1780 RepID=UPI00080B3B01|nr:aminoglycoside phosphotransferase family protein [Mycobacterium malmoense]OCB30183.1 hypothetical protein A5674_13825 [Mycobacterium malmoense]
MSISRVGPLVFRGIEVAGYTLLDKLFHKPVTSLAEVPADVSKLTPQWLTAALCGDVPGAEVTDVEVIRGDQGSTTRDRITVSYNDRGTEAGLPTKVFTKSSPRFTGRLGAGLTNVVEAEAGFYRDMRPRLDLNAPLAYYVAFDDKRLRSMFLLEDVVATRGAKCGDPTTIVVDKSMAESMVANLAALHGQCWEHPALKQQPWLTTTLGVQLKMADTIGFEKRTLLGLERSRELVPQELIARKGELWPGLMKALCRNVSGPTTLVHSDTHLGNWYQDDAGNMGLLDWQCLGIGGWALDLSYALGSALTIDDRRAWEDDLLALYLAELAKRNGEPPPFERARSEYRNQTLHGLVFWLYTIAGGPLQPPMQLKPVSRANVERLAQAVVDHGSLDI